MKAEEFLKKNVPLLKEDLEKNCLRSYTEEVMEKYANQRVIEELEALKLCNGVGMDLEIIIDDIIKELKQ